MERPLSDSLTLAPAPTRFDSTDRHVRSFLRPLVCCIVVAVSILYAGALLKSNWISGDDGLLATSAARVMTGQLPHRDFVENYTGALSYIDALAFRALGMNLVSMRVAVLCVFAVWVPVVFYLASRFAEPITAGAVTLLAVAWSLPNYPTPMPSWYNLFFATFGAAALFRYIENPRRRWLYLAGIFGGASFLIKVIGLYYVSGVLLFLVFREQLMNRSSGADQKTGSAVYRAFVTASLLLFTVSLFSVVRPNWSSGRIVHLLLPVVALVIVLLLGQRSYCSATNTQRFRDLFRMIAPFAAGVLVPIGIFLIPYFASGTVRAFYRGVFPSAVARASSLAVFDPPSAICFIFAIPPLLALLVGYTSEPKTAKIASAVVAIVGALLIVMAGKFALTTQLVFQSAEMLAPLAVLAGAAQLRATGSKFGLIREQQIMLLLSLAALCGLVQFPFAAPIYFCYYAPLLILAMLAVASEWPRPASPHMVAVMIAFYLVFAVVRFALPASLHRGFIASPRTTALTLSVAAGIKVVSPSTTEAMVATVQRHSSGSKVVAFPECPEVYFLTGLQNPTRNDGGVDPNDLLQVIRSREVNVIVINQRPFFPDSQPSPELVKAVEQAFPNSNASGKYLIRWRQ